MKKRAIFANIERSLAKHPFGTSRRSLLPLPLSLLPLPLLPLSLLPLPLPLPLLPLLRLPLLPLPLPLLMLPLLPLLLLFPGAMLDPSGQYHITAEPLGGEPFRISAQERRQLLQQLDQKQIVAELHWLSRRGQYGDLPALIKALEEIAPLTADLFYFKALLYDQLKQRERAQIAIELALKREPKLAYAWNLQGKLYLKNENPEVAQQSFWTATLLNPYEPLYFYDYAYSLHLLGKARGALAAVRNAIYLRPNYDEAYYLLALLQRKRGNLQESLQAFSRAEASGLCSLSFLQDYAEAAALAGEEKLSHRLKKDAASSEEKLACAKAQKPDRKKRKRASNRSNPEKSFWDWLFQ